MWRLINAFENVRPRILQEIEIKIKNKYVRSRNVYENKQGYDKMPEKIRTFMSKIRTFSSNQHEFCRNKRLCDDNLPILKVETRNWKLEDRPLARSMDGPMS